MSSDNNISHQLIIKRIMEKLLFSGAMIFIIASMLFATNIIKVKNEWKSVGITYGLLAIGCVFFGLLLTLNS